MNKSNKIESKNIQDILALTPMQEGMLFHYLQAPGEGSYFNQLNLELSGNINLQYFEKAWSFVLETNEMLRTVFRWEKLEKPTQVVLKRHKLHLKYEDLSNVGDDAEQKTQWEAIKQQDRNSQFDLRMVPFRVILGKISQNRYQMLISNHHILYDGWSTGIILKEFFQAYETMAMGNQPLVPRVKSGFKEFIQWHQEQDRQEQKEFWQNYLEGFDTPTRLPVKRSKANPGFQGKSNYRLHLSQAVKNKLEGFVKDKRITLAAVFYCAWAILLQKYCGIEDVVFGTTVSGRSAPIRGIEDMVGLFINTVPLRAGFEPGESLPDFLVRINNHLAASEKYENTSLVDIYSYCRQFTAVRGELFDTIVSMENYPLDTYLKEPGPHISIQSYSMEEKPHYDLTLAIYVDGGIEIDFIYNNISLATDTIVRLAHHFSTILKSIGENVEHGPHEIRLLSGEERHRLLEEFNRKRGAYANEKTIPGLFEKQAEQSPGGTALVGNWRWAVDKKEKTHITYNELNEKAGQLASLLREKGADANTFVGIMAERSIEMITGILGILKAGGAYVPLPFGSNVPEARTKYMLEECRVKILLAAPGLRVKVNVGAEVIDINTPGAAPAAYTPGGRGGGTLISTGQVNAANFAYVIFTSGSTGKPKGVPITHANLSPLLHWGYRYLALGPAHRTLQNLSYYFDWSVWEIFITLTSGACLLSESDEIILNPEACITFMEKMDITVLHATPTQYGYLLRTQRQMNTLKYLLLGAEKLSYDLAKRSFARVSRDCRVFNMYGPTECTIIASTLEFKPSDLTAFEGLTGIPIGIPAGNTGLLVLDKYMNLCPVNVSGELYIAGDGAAAGYLNNPELTAEKFDHDLWDYRDYHDEEEPFGRIINAFGERKAHELHELKQIETITNQKLLWGGQGGGFLEKSPPGRRRQKLYKTGDIARWLPDGNVEYLGRKDFQLKVRGFRIEPGEIENCLMKRPGVKEALVIAHKDEQEEVRLCVYILGTAALDELPGYLSGELPDYMVPAYFEKINTIPLTPSGKIDIQALPVPVMKSRTEYIKPRNELEKELVDIWSEVLGVEKNQIGINDHFFELGGHSLKATTLVSKIHKKLKFRFPLQQVFEMPTVRAQAAYMAKPGDSPYDSIKPVEEMEYYNLSYAQRRLWVLCQFEEDSAAYNMPRAEAISGRFDSGALIKAVQTLAHRHESLRTIFIQVDGTPRQKIVKDFTINLPIIDLREAGQEEKEKKTREIYIEDANRAFDLVQGPLFRFTLVRLEDEEYVLIFNIHHIINDGWSQGIIHNGIIKLYNKNPLPPLQLQYRDYTRWHNRRIETGHFQTPGQYWLEKFKDKPNGIQLPQDYPRRPIQTFNGGRVTRAISQETTRQLHRISHEQDATLFMSLLTLLGIFLYKYTGQTDIIVGAPIAGRQHGELHPLVGFLVNTLVYRVRVNPDHTFRQFLAAVKEEALNCYRNQDYPFDLLVEQLELDRVLSQSPLFNVMLAHNNAETLDNSLTMTGVNMSRYVYADDYNMSKFDLVFFMDEINDQVWLQLEYNSDLFEHQTIERMAENFLTLIERATREVNAPVSTMSCLADSQYQQVIHEFNTTASPYPPVLVQELFEEQVIPSKDKTALVYNEEHISYEALNSQTNQYAHYLREEHQVSPNDVIGISMERSIRMIALLLGIIKSGAAYLAVDPTYPRERVLHVLADSQAEVLVTDKIRPEFFADYPGKIIEINAQKDETLKTCSQNPVINNQASDILYVNYTSGSTGTPNGAMLSHGLLSNLIQWQRQKSSIDCSLRCLQFTTINFCVSFQEILGTLTSGGELHLIGEMERQDIDYLMDFLSRHRIENLFLPFSYLNFLFTETSRWHESFSHHLKHMITAGEQLKVTPGLEAFLNQNPRIKLHNHYGSTEMHVVTSYTLDAASAAQTPIPPSGKPISNTRIYILDEHFNPVPVGVWGELFVAGACEFLGYINNSALTGKKLIDHSHLPPGEQKMRLYRTGDMGRWQANGNIQFKGRKDLMVKIRGFRVELGEIETQLLAHPKVKEATVIVGEASGKDKYLCAYIVAKTQETGKIDPLELRENLANRLPDYMIPSYFVQLDRIPLTPNGKVDKEALPAPGLEKEKDYVAPRDNTEKKLQDIWSGVLGIEKEKIDIHDNFFHLGGHSLKATAVIARIYKELSVKVPLTEIFITPSIQALAAYIKKAEKQRFFSIKPVEKKEYYMLSSAQRRLFVLHRMDEQGIGYNMPAVWQLEGHLDAKKFEAVFQQLIKRHESLRTSFIVVKDEPVQRINRGPAPLVIEPAVSSGQPLASMIKNFIRPFDLSGPPLLRVELIETIEQKNILMVDMHHIISDGLSIEIFIKEFTELYGGKSLPALRLQYRDYSEWHNRQVGRAFMEQQAAYWLKQFAGEVPVLELPVDYPRPSIQSFAGRTLHFEMNKEETAAIKSLARDRDVTLFMLLLTVYTIFLSKLAGQQDIVVGTPTASRGHTDLEGIMGMFVNTLALRNFPVGEKTFHQFLGEIKENTITAFENRDFLYEDLVEQVAVERDTGRNPLFDTMLSLQNMDSSAVQIPGLKIAPYHYESRISKFDLTLTAVDLEDRLAFTFEYSTRLFKKETMQRFTGFFKKTVSFILEDDETAVSGIEIITEEEKNRVLLDFNDTKAEYPRDKTIQQLFAEQVEQTPDHVALKGQGQWSIEMTYGELNEKANRLARLLREQGVGPDTVVGLMVEPRPPAMIGILGILKAGGAYLPINPTLPPGRLEYILNDSAISILLSDNKTAGGTPFEKTHLYPGDGEIYISKKGTTGSNPGPAYESLANGLAYVIYTSGSTGRPKGTAVEHSQLVNFIYHMYNRYDREVGCDDRCLGLTNIMFDVSVWEFFLPLSFGARLVLMPEQKRFDVNALVRVIREERITLIYLPPGLLKPVHERLSKHRGRISLDKMLVGVEPIRDELLEDYLCLKPGIRIINGYGPTETTICATSYNYLSHPPRGDIVPIGAPLANNQVVLLDTGDRVVPGGITGEICISGDGVSRGYINNPQLTAEKYTAHPYFKERRMYRTGDLACLLPEGNIRFKGRRDQQVKIRGYRIELGEIENRLLKHNAVKQALVLEKIDEKSDKYLCAYIIAEIKLEISDLRKHLSADLPDYMLPSYFIQLEKMPLTPNGKVDRSALPEPKPGTGAAVYIGPRDAVESKLAAIWQEVLEIAESPGINADFFQLGGQSLRATILATRVHKAFNVKVPLTEIFTTPTIKGLSKYIKEAEKERYAAIKPVEKREYYALSPAQKRLYILHQMEPGNVSYNVPQVIPFPGKIDKEKLETAFRQLIRRHESIRTSFEMVGDEPQQWIHEDFDFEIEYFDLKSEFIRPFDLTQAPLLRVGLVQTGEPGENHTLVVDMHHIITDAASIAILNHQLNLLNTGGVRDLPPLRLQYKDYAQWQNSENQRTRIKEQETFWKNMYADEVPVLNLPTDFPRPVMKSFAGNTVEYPLTPKENQTLKALAKETGATLYMCILSVYTILLSKLSGQEDIVIGTPVAARRHADLDRIIGMFVNTLALRNQPTGDKGYKEFLTELKNRTLEAYENQEYQFENLVEKIDLARDTGRNPLFDVMYNFIHKDDSSNTGELPGMPRGEPGRYTHRKGASKFDLTLTAVDFAAGVHFLFEYCTQLFKPATIERFISYFKKILALLSENSQQKLCEFEIITEAEKQWILYEFNDTHAPYPGEMIIHRCIEEQVRKAPDRTALAAAQGKQPVHLTYEELNRTSNRLARRLRERGVTVETIVGLLDAGSLEMIVGLLGVLKAGGAYLPMDPESPGERAAFVLKNSDVELLLMRRRVFETEYVEFPGEIIYLDDETLYSGGAANVENINQPGHLAYLIYTSGSTGKPKGVMVEHRGLVNYIKWAEAFYLKGENCNFPLYSSLAFDLTVTSVYVPLVSGNTIVVYARDDNEFVISKILREGMAQVLKLTPTHLGMLQYGSTEWRGIRRLIVGGENLAAELAGETHRYFNEDVEIYNEYGPTEAVVGCMIHRYDPSSDRGKSVPIGKPIANVKIYILAGNHSLVPAGTAGELCIAGQGLARGYLNRPELTAEKFNHDRNYRSDKTHKSYISKRVYRTGDLARWHTDGNIEFLGRMDQQVKIRGYRIEPGEIEARLLENNDIKEAIVIAGKKKSGEEYLCAYFTTGKELEVTEVRGRLARQLPDYMIPSYFMPMEKIPLTPNGKIDRKRLPLPEVKTSQQYVAPKSDKEKIIADIWLEVLELEKAGIDDNFFELGGNSLAAIRLSRRIKEKFEIEKEIPVLIIFRYPTIRTLAAYLDRDKEDFFHSKKQMFAAIDQGRNKLKKRIEQRRSR